MFPNPTDGWITLEGYNNGNDDIGQLIISNLQGQEVYHQEITLAHGRWQHHFYLKQEGMYFIRLDTKNKMYRGAIITINE